MGLDLLRRQLLLLVGCTETFPLQLIARALRPAKQETTRFKNPSEDISDYYPGIQDQEGGMPQKRSEMLALRAIGDCSRDSACSFCRECTVMLLYCFVLGIPAQSRLNKQHATHVLKTFPASSTPDSCRNVLRPRCANSLSGVYLPSPFATAPREKECSVNGCYSSNAPHCKLRLLIKSSDQLTSDRSP
ncbi:hypothetical protein CDAR_583221 [Caerostris darwini]|uniref:Uncharacterized protein n=1 Tax=Caerostris darwini TaxID=1538125 RepID=A0AAV4R468_9ARAC|nr:hypothetical protein CDAR_583221 [Caerostris darwini]